jgi:hypothetical protein
MPANNKLPLSYTNCSVIMSSTCSIYTLPCGRPRFWVALARDHRLDGAASVTYIGTGGMSAARTVSVILADPEALGPFLAPVAVIICEPVHRRAPPRPS